MSYKYDKNIQYTGWMIIHNSQKCKTKEWVMINSTLQTKKETNKNTFNAQVGYDHQEMSSDSLYTR